MPRAPARRYSPPRPRTVSAARTRTGRGSATGAPSRRAEAAASASAASASSARVAQTTGGKARANGLSVTGLPPPCAWPSCPRPGRGFWSPFCGSLGRIALRAAAGLVAGAVAGLALRIGARVRLLLREGVGDRIGLPLVQVEPDHPGIARQQAGGEGLVAVLTGAVVAEGVGGADQRDRGAGGAELDETVPVAPHRAVAARVVAAAQRRGPPGRAGEPGRAAGPRRRGHPAGPADRDVEAQEPDLLRVGRHEDHPHLRRQRCQPYRGIPD
nr:hypothetical protein GCM10020092_089380 [Actinoplanes digitatis]